jgi:hypothetical protein
MMQSASSCASVKKYTERNVHRSLIRQSICGAFFALKDSRY